MDKRVNKSMVSELFLPHHHPHFIANARMVEALMTYCCFYPLVGATVDGDTRPSCHWTSASRMGGIYQQKLGIDEEFVSLSNRGKQNDALIPCEQSIETGLDSGHW